MIAIIVTRKPMSEGTVAANVLKHGCGALNIDKCRVTITDGASMARNNKPGDNGWKNSSGGKNSAALNGEPIGRWPANVILTGSAVVVAGFPQTEPGGGFKRGMIQHTRTYNVAKGVEAIRVRGEWKPDTGSAARFFYCVGAAETEPSV